MSRKIFTSHEELLAACEADKMYFLMPRSAGDLYMQLLYKEALQERFGGEIVFVAKASQAGVCEMFEGEFLLINNALAQLFLSPECLKLRGVFRTPTRGGIFPSHIQSHLTFQCILTKFLTLSQTHLTCQKALSQSLNCQQNCRVLAKSCVKNCQV